MIYTIELDREEDGRWLAEVMELPGVMVYGDTKHRAIMRAKLLTLKVIADQAEEEEGEEVEEMSIADSFFFEYA